ncbi:MAG: hypothetical protein R3C01_03600 [Planctomycetaceae bacterium]
MVRFLWSLLALAAFTGTVSAQDYIGGGSFGSSEPLYNYDDQESWKHGYMQVMPFYGGFHSGRPYNYHHVFSQTQTSVGWGLPHGMPYSQQWWHRYEAMADPGRSMTEPNGYLGQVQPHQQYPTMQPTQQQYVPQGSFAYESFPPSISPVQFQQGPNVSEAVYPAGAQQQGQQLRQYLNSPGVR